MNRVIITGAAGFIGSHLTDFYLNKGYEVFALVKPNKDLINLAHYTDDKKIFKPDEKKYLEENLIQIPTFRKDLTILECDLKDTTTMEQIILYTKPVYIFHFGAQSKVVLSWKDPKNTIETNVIGTLNIFEPIKNHNIETKIILACSSAEYGTTANLNRALKESDPLKALHPYGISKIASELLSRQYNINFGINSVNLRFFNQTGPRKTSDACSEFISHIAKIELGLEKPVIEVGNLETYRDITGIKDTLNAIWLAATRGISGETYNICSNKKTKIRDVLEYAISLSSKKIRIIENTPSKLRNTDEPVILGSNKKTMNVLDYQTSQSLEATLEEMFQYWINFYQKISGY
ncbi:MAG: GDP-mannose 4,6-dehydratase [Promethearchaeota archaeon]